MSCLLRDLAYYLPERVLTNHELARENPDWDLQRTEERTGVVERHIAGDGETALDLALQACRKLFARQPAAREAIDAILFCTQSEDHIMPPNSCILHQHLGLSENVFALDFNLACSGYVYGLSLARALVASGQATNLLLVTADTYSKYVHRQDRAARVLFGDGAAVTWLGNSRGKARILDTRCFTNGSQYQKFMIPAGGCRLPRSEQTGIATADDHGNVRALDNIHMDGVGVFSFFSSRVPREILGLLAKNNLTSEQIDLFIFHQASKLILDHLTAALKLDSGRVFTNLRRIGNTVSASIPIALENAMASGRLESGMLVVLSGFGVGLSWGSALIEVS